MQNVVELAETLLIKPFEGYAKQLPDGGCAAYPDPATQGPPWTIGWGCTGPDIGPGTIWTRAQAQSELTKHVCYFYTQLLKLSPGLANAQDRRAAAVVSFAYNCGLGNYRISTFKKRVDAQDWSGAAVEILKWNKAAGRVMRGLVVRRQAEALLLQGT
jgi:GH24 family phage-related lysozyme (muramidase)